MRDKPVSPTGGRTAEARLRRSFAIVARAAAAVAIVLGAVVLFGWATDLVWITNPLGDVPMVPNTALMFVMSGAALALSIRPTPSRARRWGTRALAVVTGTLAVLSLAEYAWGVDLGLTNLLVDPSRRPYWATALAFALLSSALLTLDAAPRHNVKVTELLTISALLLGALALGSYAYGASRSFASHTHHPVGMAISTSVGLIALAMGVLCARTDSGLMSILACPRVSGRVVRRVLMILLIIPIVGLFATRAQNAGLYDPPGAAVVAATAGVLVAALSAFWLGHWLDRTDVERRELRDWGEFFEHASFGVWLGSADARLMQVNEAFARLHGCTREEAKGRPLEEFFPESRREELARNIRIVHDRGHHRWESENLRKDGTVFPVVIDSGAVFDERGDVRYRATYIQDITEEKRAETERFRLAEIVQSTDDAILSKSLDGIVLDWNRGAESIFGYTAEEMIGQSTDILVPEDRRTERDELVARALAGEHVVGFDTIRVCKDGRPIPVSLTASVVRDSTGRVSGISFIERDISVLKQLEREREEWGAIVAHDLRQPASVIRIATELLEELEGEPKKKILARIEKAGERLDRMIEDLLDVSRIESRRLVAQSTRVRVATLIDEAINVTPDLARRCNVRLEPGVVDVWADAGRFSQVLSNLLSNADKYGYPQTPIDIHVERVGAMVEITVTNEGSGIDPAELPLLFSRFTRTRAARGGSAPGLGLGLYISRGLVEAQGGRMWAESTPGQRTSFHFTLPEAQPAKPRAGARPVMH